MLYVLCARLLPQNDPQETPQNHIKNCSPEIRLKASVYQRRRDDNKNKIFAFEGGGGLEGREENRPKTLVFVGNTTTIKF